MAFWQLGLEKATLFPIKICPKLGLTLLIAFLWSAGKQSAWVLLSSFLDSTLPFSHSLLPSILLTFLIKKELELWASFFIASSRHDLLLKEEKNLFDLLSSSPSLLRFSSSIHSFCAEPFQPCGCHPFLYLFYFILSLLLLTHLQVKDASSQQSRQWSGSTHSSNFN